MSFQIEHFGLYFGQKTLDAAKSERNDNKALQNAWQWLLAKEGDVIFERKLKDRETEQVVKGALSPLGQAIEAAFRYRFLDDSSAAEKTWAFLQNQAFRTMLDCIPSAHLAELVHPLVSAAWKNTYAEATASYLAEYSDAEPLDKFYLIALGMLSGIVLENEKRIEDAANRFRQVIDEQIHPEGYIKPLHEGAKEAFPAYQNMLLALGALCLTAEAGEQIGLKLWKYEKRDVGLNTAASYLVYYYFYPDKWRWGTGLTEENTQTAMRENGAFIEILTSHVNPRGVELLLDEQRPFFNPIFGGLTSLSHFKTEKRKRGFFG